MGLGADFGLHTPAFSPFAPTYEEEEVQKVTLLMHSQAHRSIFS